MVQLPTGTEAQVDAQVTERVDAQVAEQVDARVDTRSDRQVRAEKPFRNGHPHQVPVVAVVGPTASGKSDLALALAERLGGEVVNADAMQLYRGMDIGTAKLSVPERRGIPHHQLDVLDVREEASVAAYQREARADLAAIRARGHVPLLVGGSFARSR